MQIKRFIKERDKMCKISLQQRKNNFLKTNSTSVSVNLKTYGKLKNHSELRQSGGCIAGALAENQIVKHDTKSILKTIKSLYSNMAGNLLAKLQKSPNRYIIKFVSDFTKNFHYLNISNWTQQLKIICLIY